MTGKGHNIYKKNMIVSVAVVLVKNNLFCDRVYFLLLSLNSECWHNQRNVTYVDPTYSSPFHILPQGLALFGWSQPWSSSFH